MIPPRPLPTTPRMQFEPDTRSYKWCVPAAWLKRAAPARAPACIRVAGRQQHEEQQQQQQQQQQPGCDRERELSGPLACLPAPLESDAGGASPSCATCAPQWACRCARSRQRRAPGTRAWGAAPGCGPPAVAQASAARACRPHRTAPVTLSCLASCHHWTAGLPARALQPVHHVLRHQARAAVDLGVGRLAPPVGSSAPWPPPAPPSLAAPPDLAPCTPPTPFLAAALLPLLGSSNLFFLHAEPATAR